MGLSDEERWAGLFHAVSNLVRLGGEIGLLDTWTPEFSVIKQIKEKVNGLWHDLLGDRSNSSHWILGSSANSVISDGDISPLGIAMKERCDRLAGLEDDEYSSYLEYSDDFNALDMFEITKLVSEEDKVLGLIYDIYSWVEQAIYYLRRYDDEFLKQLDTFSRTISFIYGTCFTVFYQKEIYAKAYILREIVKILYSKHYPYHKEKWDVVTTWLVEEHAHHDLKRPINYGWEDACTLQELAWMHLYLYRSSEEELLFKRLETALTLIGRKLEYPHQWEKLIKSLYGTPLENRIYDVRKLRSMCFAQKREYNIHQKNQLDENRVHEDLGVYSCSIQHTDWKIRQEKIHGSDDPPED